jgi:hypothetical protein
MTGNQRLESRVRENRTHGSEGGEAQAFPTPIVVVRDTWFSYLHHRVVP